MVEWKRHACMTNWDASDKVYTAASEGGNHQEGVFELLLVA